MTKGFRKSQTWEHKRQLTWTNLLYCVDPLNTAPIFTTPLPLSFGKNLTKDSAIRLQVPRALGV